MLDENRKKGLAIMIVFCVAWCGFFIYGIIGTVKAIADRTELKENRVEVQAICESCWVETSVDVDDNGHSTTHHSYYANVSYEYNGQTYYKEKVGVTQEYSQGDYINMYVSPSDPEKAANHFSGIFWYIVTIIAELFFVVVGIGVTAVVIKFYILRDVNTQPNVNMPPHVYMNDTYEIFNSADRNRGQFRK